MFNSSRAKVAGSAGGKSKSTAKRQASRKNGKQGGRKSTRTLAERLLGRKIHDREQESIAEAYRDLWDGERSALEEHFQVSNLNDPLHTQLWKAKSRKAHKRVSYIISKFKLAASYYSKPPKEPKPYVVEYEQCPPGKQAQWEAKHRYSGVPCPPAKRKVYFEQMPGMEMFEWDMQRGVNLTVEYLMQTGGARWTKPRAEGALAYLTAKGAGDSSKVSAILTYSKADAALADTLEEEEDLPF